MTSLHVLKIFTLLFPAIVFAQDHGVGGGRPQVENAKETKTIEQEKPSEPLKIEDSLKLLFYEYGYANQEQIKNPPIPTQVKNHEVTAEIFKEYLTNSQVPAALDLLPDDETGFRCQVFSIETGEMNEWEVFLKTAESGGGRFLRLRLANSGKAESIVPLLVRTKMGWRGVQSTPAFKQELKLEELYTTKIFGKVDPEDFVGSRVHDAQNLYYGTYAGAVASVKDALVGRFDTPHKSVSANSYNTISIRSNKSDANELFIEMGTRSRIEVLDLQGNKSADGPVTVSFNVPGAWDIQRSERYYIDEKRAKIYEPHSRISEIFLPQLSMNATLPVSPAFQDLNTFDDMYRMNALGLCWKVKQKPAEGK